MKEHPPASALSRWAPSLVGAGVTVVAVAVASWWVVDRVERVVGRPPGPGWEMEGRPDGGVGGFDRSWADPSRFTPDLDAFVQEIARSEGLDPAGMPTAREMFARLDTEGRLLSPTGTMEELGRVSPEIARRVGDDTLKAVLALDVLAMAIAAREEGGQAPGGSAIAQLDASLASRLATRAKEVGADPASLMPPEAVRQAALAAGESDSPEAQALLRAYSEAFDRLDAQPR